MEDSMPLVSIGMPVYNEETYISQTLDSLLTQSFEDFELIISDNASTDRTEKVCLNYAAKDRRIHYYRSEINLGGVANCNRAVELSSAHYFMLASGHDLRHEAFISRCVEILEQDASVVLCYPKAIWMESNGQLSGVINGHVDTRGLGQVSGFQTVMWGLGYGYPIYGMIRSSALKKTGLWRKTVGPDIVLLAELALIGAFAQVPEPLLYIRRLSDFGSWDQYLAKSFGPGREMRSAWYLYSKWIYEHLRVVAKHTRSPRLKAVLMASVILCILTKYRGVLHGIQGTGKP